MLTASEKARVLVFHSLNIGVSIENATVLVIVSVIVTLALVGMVMVVRHTCRGDDRAVGDEAAAPDRIAQVDRNIQAIRDRGRVKDASARASETALLREQLNDPTDRPA